MTIIPVALEAGSYEIHVREGALAAAAAHVPAPAGGRPTVIVTDESVAALHLDALIAGLDRPVAPIILTPGERTKSWRQLEALTERLLMLGVERGDHIVALGGGVIGDLTGFAASILRRGCHFVQVPTTLLAQVDSSVGGKTAINAAAGKNLIGAFHQPSCVVIDPSVLATLPGRELRAGYAEVVKYGLIGDVEFYHWCERNAAALLLGDMAAQTRAIAVSCSAKARVVAEDERETRGRRALLNLGHTFGHALEAELGFSGQLLHGEAVAAGMALAARYSVRLGLLPEADAARIAAHFEDIGLPAAIPAAIAADANAPAQLVEHMRQDKKAAAGRVPLILMRGIGEAFVYPDADMDDVTAFLAQECGA